MSKNKYKHLRICINYAKPCVFANKCESCKNAAKKLIKQDGRTVLKVTGCKNNRDITVSPSEKEKCFICTSEGTYKCKGD